MARHVTMHHELYDMLLDYADLEVEVEEMNVGVNWTLCRAGTTGLAPTLPMTDGRPSWQGTLRGRHLGQLRHWLLDWDRSRASIGLAAVNAALNREADLVTANGAIFKGSDAMHHSIEWFLPMLRGKHVALIGPQLGALSANQGKFELHHFHSNDGGLHPACSSELHECDWLFVNANTIADKSLPQILEQAGDSHVVLYGAALPWLDEWQQFGVDYLLGCEVDDSSLLQTAVMEGQDVEQNAAALHFRLINLQPELVMMPAASRATLRSVASA
jgi:uncharacterized protein (DUF4213/DUF364 family)